MTDKESHTLILYWGVSPVGQGMANNIVPFEMIENALSIRRVCLEVQAVWTPFWTSCIQHSNT